MLARTPGRRVTCALATTIAALALPAGALAASGGGGFGGGPGTGSTGGSSGSSGATSTDDSQPVSTSGGGLTLQTTSTAMLRSGLAFSGTAAGAAQGQTIEIERNGRQTGWRWVPTVTTTVGAGGRFTATWDTDHIGRFAVRAVAAAATSARPARRAIRRHARRRAVGHAAATTPLTVTVYLPAKATLYGPGLWGRRTACGQTLTPALIGVANRSLRCGTKVSLDYQGHTLVVPVVDHGPYANGASWDLTMATGRALGMTGTAQLGAVSLPTRP